MFATRLRTRPCIARWRKSSDGRSNTSSPSSDCLIVISAGRVRSSWPLGPSTVTWPGARVTFTRSEEHTSELQSQSNLVCRLLLEKKKEQHNSTTRRLCTVTTHSPTDAHNASILSHAGQ